MVDITKSNQLPKNLKLKEDRPTLNTNQDDIRKAEKIESHDSACARVS